MNKQLIKIIQSKLDSLKSLNENEESKEELHTNKDLSQEEQKSTHSHHESEDGKYNTEENPLISDSMNDEDAYHEDDEDLRDSSKLPVPVENTFKNSDPNLVDDLDQD